MYFDNVDAAPMDAVFGLNKIYNEDPRKDKVYLVVGIYMDEHLNKDVMPSVQKAQKEVVNELTSANYLPFHGNKDFVKNYGKLVFGDHLFEKHEKRICGFQAVGGTGGLRIGGEFINKYVSKKIYFPTPTWANHKQIFEAAGFTIEEYPYYDPKENKVDVEAFLNTVSSLPEKSVLLLHAACHNPTGCDISKDDWKKLATIIKEKKHLPFLDFAYQGFKENLEKDRYPVELFVEQEIDFLVCGSCSKNFSMYCQRIGGLFIFCSDPKVKDNVHSQVGKTVRSNYSNPPAFGAAVVNKVLSDATLKEEWKNELATMRDRISTMRKQFVDGLTANAKHRDFSSLYDHQGMFSYCGLQKEEVQTLIEDYGIYMLFSGRVNVCGLNNNNIDYVVESILKVCDK